LRATAVIEIRKDFRWIHFDVRQGGYQDFRFTVVPFDSDQSNRQILGIQSKLPSFLWPKTARIRSVYLTSSLSDLL